ncbi:MAG TPA: hypothetical protein VIG24_07245, partial [Acidimicrobiia bacterium]
WVIPAIMRRRRHPMTIDLKYLIPFVLPFILVIMVRLTGLLAGAVFTPMDWRFWLSQAALRVSLWVGSSSCP